MSVKKEIKELLKETETVTDPHRQFYKVYFDDNNMDFLFQWLLGYTRHGGCEIGEMFYTAAQIEDSDPDSWAAAWPKMADRMEKRGDASAAGGHEVSAREFYMRAANYNRSALGTLLPSNPDFKKLADKSVDLFFKAGAMFDPPIEKIEVPFENTVLPGCFIKASKDSDPRKTLIMIGGNETFFTDLYFYIAPAAKLRGYNFLTVDIPGQGTLPYQGHYYRGDSEKPIGAAIDYALTRSDVDPERLAAYGISGGGYYVPRAAANDRRIKACVGNSPFADLPRALKGVSIKSREETETMTPTNYRTWQLMAWRNNCSSIPELLTFTKDFVFDPKDISCPFLGVSSAGEYANPATKVLVDEVMTGLSSKKKKLIVASFDEGAGTHCLGENTGLMSAFVFDWLDEIFA